VRGVDNRVEGRERRATCVPRANSGRKERWRVDRGGVRVLWKCAVVRCGKRVFQPRTCVVDVGGVGWRVEWGMHTIR